MSTKRTISLGMSSSYDNKQQKRMLGEKLLSEMPKTLLIEKSKSPLRWPILLLACIMLVGSYYCYDIPSALKTQIDDFMGDQADFETYFALLYTLYSIPNVVCYFYYLKQLFPHSFSFALLLII